MSDAQKIIATAGIVSVGVGSANAVLKHKRPPSSKFLIGSGVAYLGLSALAQGQPDVAQGLALGIMTTIVLGEGGGVLSYLDERGETDTQKAKKPKDDEIGAPFNNPARPLEDIGGGGDFPEPDSMNGAYRPDTVPGFPGLPQLSPSFPVFVPTIPRDKK